MAVPKQCTSDKLFMAMFIANYICIGTFLKKNRYLIYCDWRVSGISITGVDPGFQVRGGGLKKIAPSGGGREKFWVFRVKNHDFTPKNHIFSNFRGARAGCAPLDPPLHHQVRSDIHIDESQRAKSRKPKSAKVNQT